MARKRDTNAQRRKKQLAARQREREFQRNPSTRGLLEKTLSLFGSDSQAMLKMATAGASAAEIAAELQIPEQKAQRFIDQFVSLPKGVDDQLLKAPTLLGKGEAVKTLLSAALRHAKVQRGRSFF